MYFLQKVAFKTIATENHKKHKKFAKLINDIYTSQGKYFL